MCDRSAGNFEGRIPYEIFVVLSKKTYGKKVLKEIYVCDRNHIRIAKIQHQKVTINGQNLHTLIRQFGAQAIFKGLQMFAQSTHYSEVEVEIKTKNIMDSVDPLIMITCSSKLEGFMPKAFR